MLLEFSLNKIAKSHDKALVQEKLGIFNTSFSYLCLEFSSASLLPYWNLTNLLERGRLLLFYLWLSQAHLDLLSNVIGSSRAEKNTERGPGRGAGAGKEGESISS